MSLTMRKVWLRQFLIIWFLFAHRFLFRIFYLGDAKDNGMFGNFLNSPGGDWNNKFDDFNVDEDDDSDDNIPSLSQNDEDEDEGGEGDKEKKPAA